MAITLGNIGLRLCCGLLAIAVASPVFAQSAEGGEGHRYRIALGPQLIPSYPGSDGVVVRPFVEVDRARGNDTFDFEAPDESFSIPLLRLGPLQMGPAAAFLSDRTPEEVGAKVTRVPTAVEVGGFVQSYLTRSFRLRGEVRKGIGGHHGWLGDLSADYIAREGDYWLFSIGPRLSFADDRYQETYFGVSGADAVASGLPVYHAKGGLKAVELTTGYLQKLNTHWGFEAYARYARLVGDAARSPLVTGYGSRNQVYGGIALSYTFTRRK